jgi:hypothetical protein
MSRSQDTEYLNTKIAKSAKEELASVFTFVIFAFFVFKNELKFHAA